MNKDQYQDKYEEVFRGMKEEKMDWGFEEFLQKADEAVDDKMIPIEKAKPSFPKWFWMAASLLVLLTLWGTFRYNQENMNLEEQSKLVESQVLKQKTDFIEENHEPEQQVALHSMDSIAGTKKDSIFQESTIAEKDVMDEILPKRGRLKKEVRPKFVENTSYKKYNTKQKDSTGYKNNYVIVNGKRIDNVEEAINVTKYSFQIFANNVSEKLQSKVMDDDY